MTQIEVQKLFEALNGQRVESRYLYACVYCGAKDGVLRQHWCKDELELYCDRCERWTGDRLTCQDIVNWPVQTLITDGATR